MLRRQMKGGLQSLVSVRQEDNKKDRLFAAAGIPFMRLRPVGSPSENTIRAQVAEHVDELVRSLRADLCPGTTKREGCWKTCLALELERSTATRPLGRINGSR